MQTITRELWFSYGHRLFNHEGECANLHGHNATLYITAQGKLDSIGRVLDFKALKDRFDPWINKNWDHAFLWNTADPVCRGLFRVHESTRGMKNYMCLFNPTAENMAAYLLEDIAPKLMEGTGVLVTQIQLYETERCWAIATLDGVKTVDCDKPTPTPDRETEHAL